MVQSRDEAEIVVPNSDLITNQVINWTLSARHIRLKIPVGVTYGSDVTLVMRILKEIAESNLSVLSDPAPRVIFLGFGDSSLDFEIRLWLRDFLGRRQVQSELNREIERRFRSEGIKIPFPQRDLHVHSVEESPGSILTPTGDKSADLVAAPRKEKDEEDKKDP